MKTVIVKGVFAGQERRGWFPALTGNLNLTGLSDKEASSTKDPEKLEWLVEFALNQLERGGSVRVVDSTTNLKFLH